MQTRHRQLATSKKAPRVILLAAMASVTFAFSASAADPATPPAKVDLTPTTPYSDQISLGDLRDVGLCIMQIKQQSINIYLEVTRKPIETKINPQMPDPMAISITGLDPKAKYLPTRPEWLTFYVGTMEPIIHLFKEDVKDAETGVQKIVVPKKVKDKFEKVFDDYETAVEQLNTHLTTIYNQIGEPDNNVKIAKEAVKIFEVAEEIEKDRQIAFHLLQKTDGDELEQIVPKKKE